MTTLVKWFKYRHGPYSKLQSKQEHLLGKKIALSLPVVTRWHSNLDCMNSVWKSKDAFKSVILELTIKTALLNTNRNNKYGKEVFEMIEDPNFWSNLSTVKTIVEPFVKIIIGMERNAPQLSKIYGSYSWLLTVVQEETAEHLREQVMKIVSDRWNKIADDNLCMAALLDVTLPEYQQKVLQTHFNLKRALLIFHDKFGQEKGNTIYKDFLAFQSCQASYEEIFFPKSPENSCLTGLQWWAEQFTEGDLSEYAQQLLSVIPSSGASERVWSTFGYIHSKSRNRLKNKQVEKLVYIYTNNRLLSDDTYTPTWFAEDEVPMEGEACPDDEIENPSDSSVLPPPLSLIPEFAVLE